MSWGTAIELVGAAGGAVVPGYWGAVIGAGAGVLGAAVDGGGAGDILLGGVVGGLSSFGGRAVGTAASKKLLAGVDKHSVLLTREIRRDARDDLRRALPGVHKGAMRKSYDNSRHLKPDELGEKWKALTDAEKTKFGMLDQNKATRQKVRDALAYRDAKHARKNYQDRLRERRQRKIDGSLAKYKKPFTPGEAGSWGTRGLRALGGAGLMGALTAGWGAMTGSPGSNGDGADPATDRIAAPGTWVGGHVQSMGEGPFRQGAGEGIGFLFQPDGIAADLQGWYAAPGGMDGNGSLADGLSDNWQLFGDEGAFDTDNAVVPSLPTVPMQLDAQTPAAYQEAASRLVQAAQRFDAIQQEVAEQIVETAENTELGREQISALIRGINLKAQTSDGTDASFVDLLGQAFTESLSTVEERAGTNSEIEKVVSEMEDQMNKALEEQQKSMEEALKQLPKPNDPSYPYNPGQLPGVNPGQLPGNPLPQDPGHRLPEVPTPTIPAPSDPADPAGTPTPPPTPDIPDRPDPVIPGDRGTPNDPSTPPVAPPVVPPPGDIGSSPIGMGGMGSNLLNSLWPLLAAQQGGMFGQRPMGMGDDPRRLDRERLAPVRPAEVEPARVPPPPAPAQPAGASAGQSGAVATPSVPPSGATAPPDSGTPPTRGAARADGKVPYTFTGGQTVWVSPKVYDALVAAVADTTGTDARAAYGMAPATSAKTGDPKDKYPGSRVDPHQLMTGDIAMWEDGRTALLVVFEPAEEGGSAQDGVLKVIVSGALKQFAPEMSDAEEDFGAFAGFFHPPGIEGSGSGSEAIPATDPTLQPVPAMPVPAGG
ncbi:HMG-box domain-containing protein [Nocardia mangyaensis]|nr:hypothetical protein [Nocardia mangyaensis]